MLPGGNVSLDGSTAELLNLSDMETLTSAEAAARLGVNAQKFHRLVAAHELTPIVEGNGKYGPKFWDPADISRVAELERAS